MEAVSAAQAHLQEFDVAKTSIVETERVASALAASFDPLPAQLAALPLELLVILSEHLQIPRACVGDVEDLDAGDILLRERFLERSPSLLALAHALSGHLPPMNDDLSSADVKLRAKLLLSYGRFTRAWSQECFLPRGDMSIAMDICTRLLSDAACRKTIIRELLNNALPPFFRTHPKINPSTGRVRSRTPGGPSAMTDWFEQSEQDQLSWRNEPGLAGVVHLVVATLEKEETEELWHLILPPLLAYLDDYDSPNKLVGVSLLDALLPRVDSSLLQRTGVGRIFEQSLTSIFSSLALPHGPALFLSASRTSLTLLHLLHPSASTLLHRTALATLFHASILHLWSFHAGSLPHELAGLQAMEPLVKTMGVMGARFLGSVVPHLCELVERASELRVGEVSGVHQSVDVGEVVVCAARALESVLCETAGRNERWRGRVVGAVGKAWVSTVESQDVTARGEAGKERKEAVQTALRGVLDAVGDEPFARRLAELDPMFLPLVRRQPSVETKLDSPAISVQ